MIRYLMMGLLDLEKVISLTGFKSQVLHNLNIIRLISVKYFWEEKESHKQQQFLLTWRRRSPVRRRSRWQTRPPAGWRRPPSRWSLCSERGRLDHRSPSRDAGRCLRPLRWKEITCHNSFWRSDVVWDDTEQKGSSPESQTVAMSPVVSLADTAVTGLLWPVRLWT